MGETLIEEKAEIPPDGGCIYKATNNKRLKIVCNQSYQPNLYPNIGELSWDIHYYNIKNYVR